MAPPKVDAVYSSSPLVENPKVAMAGPWTGVR
jgi:hypothetical protein